VAVVERLLLPLEGYTRHYTTVNLLQSDCPVFRKEANAQTNLIYMVKNKNASSCNGSRCHFALRWEDEYSVAANKMVVAFSFYTLINREREWV
jgi:hypothetical protein